MRSFGIALAIALFLVTLIPAAGSAQEGGLAARVAELEAQVAALEEILQFVYVETEEINYLAGPHLIIEGANVHVRSGSGNTVDDCELGSPDFPNCESLTGLGNLIVGYNERAPRLGGRPLPREIRTGSHNLVVGDLHAYSSFGGFIAGDSNKVTGANASVSGGSYNRASGSNSSICGGQGNAASGHGSSVSGGQVNAASGYDSSVSGGRGNVASGHVSSVSGGENREAPDSFNWAAGNLFEPN
jgi:hypothetical protein